jgi:TldD protein
MESAAVSRRHFLATGSALIAATYVPAWADIWQQGRADDADRAEVAEAALARATALGASYADVRVNRYRRESIATRERQVQNVSRSTSRGLGLRVLVNGAWGFAATNRLEPAAARDAADQAVAIARASAVLASRKVVLADAEKVVTTWTSAFARDPFEVPLDAKIAFLLKLNETTLTVSGVSFVSSQVLFADEQKYFASSEGSRITQRLVRTYPQFSTTAADRASGDFQTRTVVDRAQLVGYEYVENYPWLQDAEKAGHEVVEKLKSKPVSAGRYDIVVDPSQLFLAIHESVGHSTELDRSLGWEANMAGTSFLKAGDAGKLRFGAPIVNLVGDRTQPGGLATTGFDDEGVKADRWHLVRDGMFVDW